MIRVRLSDRDLVGLRLSYAPYWDMLCAAVQAATTERSRRTGGTPLVKMAHRLLELPSLQYFAHGVIPSFLTAPTERGEPLEATLSKIDPAGRDEVDRSLARYVTLFPRHRDAILRAWSDPQKELAAVRATFRRAWQGGFAAAWPSIEAVHLSDIGQRSLALANAGPIGVLDGLAPTLSVADYDLFVGGQCEWAYKPAGAGVTLVSSVFAPDRLLGGHLPDGRWLVIYPPQGRSLALLDERESPAEQMTDLIGPVRAQILATLVVPHTTVEIASTCGLAPNTVSYHLARLREAGMVVAARSGNRAYYRLAPRGRQFVALWADTRLAS